MLTVQGKAALCSWTGSGRLEGRGEQCRGRGTNSHQSNSQALSRSARSSGRIAEASTSKHPTSPLDIIRDDVDFLAAHSSLLQPLSPVKDAHDQVVALFNPIAGQQMANELEEQIAGLQQELAQAHQEVHSTEARLHQTLDDLNSLASSMSVFSSSSAPDAQPSDASSLPAFLDSTDSAPSTSYTTAQQPTAAQRSSVNPRSTPAAVKRSSRLRASSETPQALKEFWYPAEFSSQLGLDTLVPIELLGESWVLFRGPDGQAACVKDECAHRACPLSLGAVVEGHIQCPYHGWEYDPAGTCTKMPSTVHCKGIKVTALPVSESGGFVWVFPGSSASPPRPPSFVRPPPGFTVHAELVLEVPVEHGLLLENLLDLAHAPFTHTSTFAKGWPVPDVVKFNARRLLGGHWEPYPIDMSFEPPCGVLSTIGLAQPGKIMRGARAASCRNHLHQLHVCVPAGPGRTRLLYRMSMDFMGWARHVPGIRAFWKHIAGQVLGEDLVLVRGQQERMAAGADVWAHPVAYDKLGVRYRRWRNSLNQQPDSPERRQAEADLANSMSAGEIFAPESA